MAHEIEGEIKIIGETETFGSGFSKRLLILEVESGNYKNENGFEFTKDNTALLDSVSVGDTVKVSIWDAGTRATYWEKGKKWFAQFPQAFKIETVSAGGQQSAPPSDKAPADFEEYEDDDPFIKPSSEA